MSLPSWVPKKGDKVVRFINQSVSVHNPDDEWVKARTDDKREQGRWEVIEFDPVKHRACKGCMK